VGKITVERTKYGEKKPIAIHKKKAVKRKGMTRGLNRADPTEFGGQMNRGDKRGLGHGRDRFARGVETKQHRTTSTNALHADRSIEVRPGIRMNGPHKGGREKNSRIANSGNDRESWEETGAS